MSKKNLTNTNQDNAEERAKYLNYQKNYWNNFNVDPNANPKPSSIVKPIRTKSCETQLTAKEAAKITAEIDAEYKALRIKYKLGTPLKSSSKKSHHK